jgi:hypothetical protein
MPGGYPGPDDSARKGINIIPRFGVTNTITGDSDLGDIVVKAKLGFKTSGFSMIRDHSEMAEGGDLLAYRSKWCAGRRKRLNPDKVRSTIQRLGRTSNPTAVGQPSLLAIFSIASRAMNPMMPG